MMHATLVDKWHCPVIPFELFIAGSPELDRQAHGSRRPELSPESLPWKGKLAFWKSLANGWLLLFIAPIWGCAGGPRDFRKIDSKAPLVRARAVSLGTDQPSEKVIPKLVKHLDDSDPVVRLAAYQELHRRTGNDFGFVPWDEPQARQSAIERWRAWIKQGMPRQPRAPAVAPSSQAQTPRPGSPPSRPTPQSQIPPPVTQSPASH